MSTAQNQQIPSIEQQITDLRNRITLTHAAAEEASKQGFDKLVSLLIQQQEPFQQLANKNKELLQILEKNNIKTVSEKPKTEKLKESTTIKKSRSRK